MAIVLSSPAESVGGTFEAPRFDRNPMADQAFGGNMPTDTRQYSGMQPIDPKNYVTLLDGRTLSRGAIAGMNHGTALLALMDRNAAGTRGFVEAYTDVKRLKGDLPFVGDLFGVVMPVKDILRVRDISKRIEAGETVSDEDMVLVQTFVEDQKRMSQTSTMGMVGDIARTMSLFAAEIYLYVKMGTLGGGAAGSAAGGVGAAPGAVGGAIAGASVGAVRGTIKGARYVAKKMLSDGIQNRIGKLLATTAGKQVAARTVKFGTGAVRGALTGAAIAGVDTAVNALANTAMGQDAAMSRGAAERYAASALAGEDMSLGMAKTLAIGDRLVEYISEMSGEAFSAFIPSNQIVAKAFDKVFGPTTARAAGALAKGTADVAAGKLTWVGRQKVAALGALAFMAKKMAVDGDIGAMLARLSKFGYDGYVEELLEERYGDFIRGFTGISGEGAGFRNALSEMIPDKKQLAAEMIGFAIPLGATVAIKRGHMAAHGLTTSTMENDIRTVVMGAQQVAPSGNVVELDAATGKLKNVRGVEMPSVEDSYGSISRLAKMTREKKTTPLGRVADVFLEAGSMIITGHLSGLSQLSGADILLSSYSRPELIGMHNRVFNEARARLREGNPTMSEEQLDAGAEAEARATTMETLSRLRQTFVARKSILERMGITEEEEARMTPAELVEKMNEKVRSGELRRVSYDNDKYGFWAFAGKDAEADTDPMADAVASLNATINEVLVRHGYNHHITKIRTVKEGAQAMTVYGKTSLAITEQELDEIIANPMTVRGTALAGLAGMKSPHRPSGAAVIRALARRLKEHKDAGDFGTVYQQIGIDGSPSRRVKVTKLPNGRIYLSAATTYTGKGSAIDASIVRGSQDLAEDLMRQMSTIDPAQQAGWLEAKLQEQDLQKVEVEDIVFHNREVLEFDDPRILARMAYGLMTEKEMAATGDEGTKAKARAEKLLIDRYGPGVKTNAGTYVMDFGNLNSEGDITISASLDSYHVLEELLERIMKIDNRMERGSAARYHQAVGDFVRTVAAVLKYSRDIPPATRSALLGLTKSPSDFAVKTFAALFLGAGRNSVSLGMYEIPYMEELRGLREQLQELRGYQEWVAYMAEVTGVTKEGKLQPIVLSRFMDATATAGQKMEMQSQLLAALKPRATSGVKQAEAAEGAPKPPAKEKAAAPAKEKAAAPAAEARTEKPDFVAAANRKAQELFGNSFVMIGEDQRAAVRDALAKEGIVPKKALVPPKPPAKEEKSAAPAKEKAAPPAKEKAVDPLVAASQAAKKRRLEELQAEAGTKETPEAGAKETPEEGSPENPVPAQVALKQLADANQNPRAQATGLGKKRKPTFKVDNPPPSATPSVMPAITPEEMVYELWDKIEAATPPDGDVYSEFVKQLQTMIDSRSVAERPIFAKAGELLLAVKEADVDIPEFLDAQLELEAALARNADAPRVLTELLYEMSGVRKTEQDTATADEEEAEDDAASDVDARVFGQATSAETVLRSLRGSAQMVRALETLNVVPNATQALYDLTHDPGAWERLQDALVSTENFVKWVNTQAENESRVESGLKFLARKLEQTAATFDVNLGPLDYYTTVLRSYRDKQRMAANIARMGADGSVTLEPANRGDQAATALENARSRIDSIVASDEALPMLVDMYNRAIATTDKDGNLIWDGDWMSDRHTKPSPSDTASRHKTRQADLVRALSTPNDFRARMFQFLSEWTGSPVSVFASAAATPAGREALARMIEQDVDVAFSKHDNPLSRHNDRSVVRYKNAENQWAPLAEAPAEHREKVLRKAMQETWTGVLSDNAKNVGHITEVLRAAGADAALLTPTARGPTGANYSAWQSVDRFIRGAARFFAKYAPGTTIENGGLITVPEVVSTDAQGREHAYQVSELTDSEWGYFVQKMHKMGYFYTGVYGDKNNNRFIKRPPVPSVEKLVEDYKAMYNAPGMLWIDQLCLVPVAKIESWAKALKPLIGSKVPAEIARREALQTALFRALYVPLFDREVDGNMRYYIPKDIPDELLSSVETAGPLPESRRAEWTSYAMATRANWTKRRSNSLTGNETLEGVERFLGGPVKMLVIDSPAVDKNVDGQMLFADSLGRAAVSTLGARFVGYDESATTLKIQFSPDVDDRGQPGLGKFNGVNIEAMTASHPYWEQLKTLMDATGAHVVYFTGSRKVPSAGAFAKGLTRGATFVPVEGALDSAENIAAATAATAEIKGSDLIAPLSLSAPTTARRARFAKQVTQILASAPSAQGALDMIAKVIEANADAIDATDLDTIRNEVIARLSRRAGPEAEELVAGLKNGTMDIRSPGHRRQFNVVSAAARGMQFKVDRIRAQVIADAAGANSLRLSPIDGRVASANANLDGKEIVYAERVKAADAADAKAQFAEIWNGWLREGLSERDYADLVANPHVPGVEGRQIKLPPVGPFAVALADRPAGPREIGFEYRGNEAWIPAGFPVIELDANGRPTNLLDDAIQPDVEDGQFVLFSTRLLADRIPAEGFQSMAFEWLRDRLERDGNLIERSQETHSRTGGDYDGDTANIYLISAVDKEHRNILATRVLSIFSELYRTDAQLRKWAEQTIEPAVDGYKDLGTRLKAEASTNPSVAQYNGPLALRFDFRVGRAGKDLLAVAAKSSSTLRRALGAGVYLDAPISLNIDGTPFVISRTKEEAEAMLTPGDPAWDRMNLAMFNGPIRFISWAVDDMKDPTIAFAFKDKMVLAMAVVALAFDQATTSKTGEFKFDEEFADAELRFKSLVTWLANHPFLNAVTEAVSGPQINRLRGDKPPSIAKAIKEELGNKSKNYLSKAEWDAWRAAKKAAADRGEKLSFGEFIAENTEVGALIRLHRLANSIRDLGVIADAAVGTPRVQTAGDIRRLATTKLAGLTGLRFTHPERFEPASTVTAKLMEIAPLGFLGMSPAGNILADAIAESGEASNPLFAEDRQETMLTSIHASFALKSLVDESGLELDARFPATRIRELKDAHKAATGNDSAFWNLVAPSGQLLGALELLPVYSGPTAVELNADTLAKARREFDDFPRKLQLEIAVAANAAFSPGSGARAHAINMLLGDPVASRFLRDRTRHEMQVHGPVFEELATAQLAGLLMQFPGGVAAQRNELSRVLFGTQFEPVRRGARSVEEFDGTYVEESGYDPDEFARGEGGTATLSETLYLSDKTVETLADAIVEKIQPDKETALQRRADSGDQVAKMQLRELKRQQMLAAKATPAQAPARKAPVITDLSQLDLGEAPVVEPQEPAAPAPIEFSSRLDNGFRLLSNFVGGPIELDGVSYPTAEHAYQAAKFQGDKGAQGRGAVLSAATAATARKRGSQHPITTENFDAQREEIMRRILQAKLEQVPGVREALAASGNAPLVHLEPWARGEAYWGIKDGKGANTLGKLWEELRGSAAHETAAAQTAPQSAVAEPIPGTYKDFEVVQEPQRPHPVHGGVPAARLVTRADGSKYISIDPAELRRQYEAGQWTAPRTPGVTALPADAFPTLADWANFVMEHEVQHTNFPRVKPSEGAAYGANEDAINRAAARALGVSERLYPADRVAKSREARNDFARDEGTGDQATPSVQAVEVSPEGKVKLGFSWNLASIPERVRKQQTLEQQLKRLQVAKDEAAAFLNWAKGKTGDSVELQKQFEAEVLPELEIVMASGRTFYERLSVNQGQGTYKAYFIKTPFPVPGQHGAFTDPNLAGWFRVRENTEPGVLEVQEFQTAMATLFEFADWADKTKTLADIDAALVKLRERLAREMAAGEATRATENRISKVEEARGQAVGFDAPWAWKGPNNETLLMNALGKDKTHEEVFVNAITQWARNHGFTKVRFPTGETAARVEGHQAIADRLQDLTAQKNAILNNTEGKPVIGQFVVGGDAEGHEQPADMLGGGARFYETEADALAKIDAEIQNLKTQGIEKLAPIEAFYEKRVASIVNRMGAVPVTDANGNTWREVDVTKEQATPSVQAAVVSVPKQLTEHAARVVSLLGKYGIRVGDVASIAGLNEVPAEMRPAVLLDRSRKVAGIAEGALGEIGLDYAAASFLVDMASYQDGFFATWDAIKNDPYVQRLVESKREKDPNAPLRVHQRAAFRDLAVPLVAHHMGSSQSAPAKSTIQKVLGFLRSVITNLRNMLLSDSFRALDAYSRQLAHDFLSGKDNIRTTVKEGYVQTNLRAMLASAPGSAGVLRRVLSAVPGAMLTGSASFAEQGTVYRPGDAGLHDIDLRVNNVKPEDISSIKQQIAAALPNAFLVYDFTQRGFHTLTYLVPQGDRKIVDVRRDADTPRLTSYRVVDPAGNEVGRYAATVEKLADGRTIIPVGGEAHTGERAFLTDYFLGMPAADEQPAAPITPELTDEQGISFKVPLVHYSVPFAAKLSYSRFKDIWDFNRFVPYDDPRMVSQPVTDANGNTWREADVTKEQATPSVQAAGQAPRRKGPLGERAPTLKQLVNWRSYQYARDEGANTEFERAELGKEIREAWAPYREKLEKLKTFVEAHDYIESLRGKKIHSPAVDAKIVNDLDIWAETHLPLGTTPQMLLQTELGGDTAPAYQQLDFSKLLFDASDRATPSVRPVIETFEGWHTPAQGGGAAFLTQRLVQESSFAMGERNRAKRWYVGLVQEWGLDGVIRKFEEHTFKIDAEGKEGEYKRTGLKMWWPSINAPKLTDNQRKAITLLHYAAFQGLEYTARTSDQHRRLKAGEDFNVILGIPVEADLETLETILPAPLAARLFKAVQDAKASVARPAQGNAAAERAYERAVARVLYTKGLARFQLRSTKKRGLNLDPERHLTLEDWNPRNMALVVSANEVRKALKEAGAEGELSAYDRLVEAGRDKNRLNLETLVNEAADQLDGMHRRLRSRVPWLMRRDSLFLKYREGYSVHYFGSGYMGPNEKEAQMQLERLIDEAELRNEATFNAVMRYGKAEDMSDRPLDDVTDRMFNYLYDLKGIPYPGRDAAMAAIRDGELVPHGIAPGADYAAIATEIHIEVMQLLYDRRLANQALEDRLDSIENPVELAKMLGEIRKRFKKRESTNRARQRQFDTFEDAFVLGGKRPLGLGVGDAVQRYATDVMLSARTRVVLNEAVYTEDADGNMLVVPDPDLNADADEDYELLAKDVWDMMASRLAENFKYTLDPRKSAKQNVKDIIDKHIKNNPRYQRVAAPFSSVPAFYGYRKPGGEENVLDALFAGGEVPGLLKKIYGKPWEDPYGILKFLEHANQWMKVQSLQFSLFFPIAAQESLLALLGHKYFSKDGLPSQVEMRRMIKAQHPWVMSMLREADSLGLELGSVVSPLDVSTDLIASDIEFLHDFTAKNFGDTIAWGVKGLLSLSRKQTDFMFESYFNTVKLWAYMRFKHDLQERALNEGREFDLQEEIGPYMDHLNSEIGGINWNKVAWMTPSWRRNLQLLMFSPNWSQSAVNAAGFGAFTAPILKNYNTPEELRLIMRHRWPNIFLWVMLLAPAVVQAAAYSIAAAFGGVDDDDEFLMFNNEEGRKLHADITPLMRLMPWYKGAPTGQRRTYIRWGKQAYETKRWLEAPWSSLMGKSSQIARWALEMATGESVGGYGWSLPFQDQGLIGWVRDKDGNFMGSRLGYTVQKFMPFSLLAWAQNPDAAPLQIIGPTSKGISFYNATQAYMGILDTWARSTTYEQLYRNPRIQANLEALGFATLEAARRNGYDPKKVIKSAVGAVMKDLYANLYKAVDANDQKGIERWSRAILRLNGTVNRALQSTRNRDKMYGTPAELSKEHEALVREAFENP